MLTQNAADAPQSTPSEAIVIGAGLGGLAAAMRLGAKGYRVTVVDRLDMPGGRGSSISQGGHRFDLGPTIVTVPQGMRELWAACGRDFDADVDLRALDAFYEIRWDDGSKFTACREAADTRAEVERLKEPRIFAPAELLDEMRARAERAESILGKLQSLHGCSQEMVVHWCEHAAKRAPQ